MYGALHILNNFRRSTLSGLFFIFSYEHLPGSDTWLWIFSGTSAVLQPLITFESTIGTRPGLIVSSSIGKTRWPNGFGWDSGMEIRGCLTEWSWFERFINLRGKDLDCPLVHSINIKGVYVRLLPVGAICTGISRRL